MPEKYWPRRVQIEPETHRLYGDKPLCVDLETWKYHLEAVLSRADVDIRSAHERAEAVLTGIKGWERRRRENLYLSDGASAVSSSFEWMGLVLKPYHSA